MAKFYVTKLFSNSGIVRPDTVIYGDVEIRPPKSDSKDECAAIISSKEYCDPNLNHELVCRICTIVECNSLSDAEQLADEKFVSVIDLLSREFVISKIEATQCGYIKNLDTGEISPIKPANIGPNTTYVRPTGRIQRFEFNQWIIAQKTDLAERYKRSIHWTRNSKWEKGIQTGILFNWFSIEALFKEDANDDVTSLLLLFLGFPGSTYSKDISRRLLTDLAQDSNYAKWKRIIRDNVVEKIRTFRNNSVHSGFRSVDYSFDELSLYSRVMTLSSARCQAAVEVALQARLTTITEFKEYAGIIFENRAGLKNDIIGTVVFMLDNDFMKGVRRTYV